MQWNRRIAAVAAAAFTVTALFTSCGSAGKDHTTEDHVNTSTVIEEYAAGNYEWAHLDISARGEGKRTSSKVPDAYLVPEGYYDTTEYDKTVEGVRRTAYGVKLTHLKNADMMANINSAVTDAQLALRNDVSWVDEAKSEELLSTVEDAAKVEPTNYSAADVTVFGHVLSINILYLHIYNVSDAEGDHLADETVDEGRLLMNFDLRTGKVISLPSLFFDDVDYISLLAGYMNKVGQEVGYRFAKPINGFPEDYDVYCLSGTGLVVGLTTDNPFIRGGEETWFSISLSDLIDSMDVDPEESRIYFDEEVTLRKLAFRVKDVAFTETEVKDLFSEETVALPLVSGISSAGKINEDLQNWYQTILNPENYSEETLAAGGSISAETQAPAGLVNVTVFVFSAADNEYITLARCYDAKTGAQLKVGDLLTRDARILYGSGVSSAASFRVSNDFVIGVPEQDGVPEYFLTKEGDMDLSRFE